MNSLKAIILAAGRGERLYPLTKEKPKCLIDIGGVTILEHQIHNLRLNGITDVVLITGYMADMIEKTVSNIDSDGMNIKLIYNPHYDVSNNLVSLSMALDDMNSDFIIINGDDVFHPDIIKKLILADDEEITLMINIKDEYDTDDMNVTIKDEKIIEVNKNIKNEDANGESIGIMKFIGAGVYKMRDMVARMVETPEGKNDYYLKAIQNIANEYNIVGYADVGELPWGEVDYPEDLEYVREKVIKEINSLK